MFVDGICRSLDKSWRKFMDNRRFVTIKTFGNELDAKVARQHLKSHGIDATVSKDDCGGMRPWLQAQQGVVLQVLERDFQKATKVLEAMKV
jgi:hypothetical protein